ncbi:MAG: HAMP domain-containing protein [Planctomycetes bacterium]|nr:HAMP domain-containing protein [Planctomycetota bacterium]
MRKQIHKIYHRILVFLHLSPLSLAEKCRFAFGIAILIILGLALAIPYIWMGQLTQKSSLDSGRAKAEALLRTHFQIRQSPPTALAALDNDGKQMDANEPEVRWFRFKTENQKKLDQLTKQQREMMESLKTNPDRDDNIILIKKDDVLYSHYIRIFRATENCIGCHNKQGSAAAFNSNEPIGAAVIETEAGGITRTILMNRILIILAYLIGGVGAVVAFYIIVQRVILSPVRQLRAIANNVAEGNLDIRSAINTRDEYEKLSDAFNHMLDGLQAAQQKLRQSNRQLDHKIAELSERNIELFKANKLKDEFLANISHEFRTPLNAILGFAEIIREKPEVLKEDKAKRYAENIIIGGKNLLHMINDLLDMAKSEAGKVTLHIEKISLQQLCRAIVASFAGLTRKKRIKVKLRIDENIPELMTDGGKVQQILYNLLSNAVKFTPEQGRIEIKAEMTDDRHVRIAVADTGCGIAEADKEKVFEKFRQLDGSITRQTTGSGLGLAISNELAAMLAGSISMQSDLGKGSNFWLDMPITLTKEPDDQTKERA